jgi:hypothetical protein
MAGSGSEEIIPLGRFEKVKDEMRKCLAGTEKMLIGETRRVGKFEGKMQARSTLIELFESIHRLLM